jgi:hypothetical protein
MNMLPDIKLLIEYDGPQHTLPQMDFGGRSYYELIRKHDKRRISFVKSTT